jgi:hypothetical protein
MAVSTLLCSCENCILTQKQERRRKKVEEEYDDQDEGEKKNRP